MKEYQEGADLAARKQWKEAEARFARVAAFRAAPPVLLALGRAQIENGKLATAKVTLERAASDSDPRYANIVADARDALRTLESRVPRLEVVLPAGVDNAEIMIDGARREGSGAIEVDPGVEHRVVVKAPGREPFVTTFSVNEGETKTIEAALTAEGEPGAEDMAATAAIDEGPKPEEKGGRNIVGPLILGGAGLAAGIVGLVVRLGGQSDYDDASAQCDPSCPDQATVDRGNDARSTMLTGTIVAGIGLAAVAGAGVWWALSGSGDSASESVQVGVATGPAGPMAVVRGAL